MIVLNDVIYYHASGMFRTVRAGHEAPGAGWSVEPPAGVELRPDAGALTEPPRRANLTPAQEEALDQVADGVRKPGGSPKGGNRRKAAPK